MNDLSWDFVFREKFREWIRTHPDLEETLRKKLVLFSESPFHPELGSKPISGTGAGVYGFPINDKYILIFIFIDPDREKPVLVDIVRTDEISREKAVLAT